MDARKEIKTAKIGDVYGRLTVIAYGERDKWNRVSRVCRCECGKEVVAAAGDLRSGYKKSCGCLFRDYQTRRKENPKERKKESPTQKTWRQMIRRCKQRREYISRGIKVCDRWLGSFQAFLDDMGEKPEGMTLDRIDNDKGYEPRNCRWATPKCQANNRIDNVVLTHDGQTMTLSQWAEKLSVKVGMLHARIKRYGWSVEDALTTPAGHYKKRT